jgi:hypothetical protein
MGADERSDPAATPANDGQFTIEMRLAPYADDEMPVPGELKPEGALSNRMPVIDVRMLGRRANEGGYERRLSSRTLALCLIFRC